MFSRPTRAAVLSVAALLMCVGSVQAQDAVNVYSYRQPSLIEPLFQAFTEQTGIFVNVVFAKKGLIERIVTEGENSPADILLTADMGRLVQAVEAGITQPVSSGFLEENIPPRWRDENGHWFGLTQRARVAFVSRRLWKFRTRNLTYEDLADEKWRGKICMRDGQHPYNIGLFSAFLHHHGEAQTFQWLEALKANLARRPSGNDRAQVRAVFAGQCDIAIGNTYYMGKMLNNPKQIEWAKSVRIVFPTFEKGGVHINISGMVMALHAPNTANAVALMEFLASEQAQALYAEINFEYPINPRVSPSKLVSSWGTFKADSTSLEEIARLWLTASYLVDQTGFND